ncbi:hypothetical protein LMG28614_06895 [Paraburkholderia ultramafica]|uniref:Uncharacterized protein n=1 Tax=Paraburkholderia ultramafica TaxID=1544867 RepID=A0A6S7CG51_9BURK|nr:hypothetical protein LMG28614_06895 [Paraburkholderia ultramafica]
MDQIRNATPPREHRGDRPGEQDGAHCLGNIDGQWLFQGGVTGNRHRELFHFFRDCARSGKHGEPVGPALADPDISDGCSTKPQGRRGASAQISMMARAAASTSEAECTDAVVTLKMQTDLAHRRESMYECRTATYPVTPHTRKTLATGGRSSSVCNGLTNFYNPTKRFKRADKSDRRGNLSAFNAGDH